MITKKNQKIKYLSIYLLMLLTACATPDNTNTTKNNQGLEIKLLMGSALGDFCEQAAERFNQQQPKLNDGTSYYISCDAKGSGDVVTTVMSFAEQFQTGILSADAPEFPTIISVDGEIYHAQLKYRMEQLFPGQNYIPEITDAPMLTNSPMVFMAQEDIANAIENVDDLFKPLVTAKIHRDINSSAPPTPIYYVHTAPTRSNSGLQTLVSQFASVSGKRPENMTVADVTRYQNQVQQIQSKITRYGKSTSSLAKSMVKNGPFWASIGSVYESSVIAANTHRQPGQPKYRAVYPQATFTSNMRAIVANAPWVSEVEKAAATEIIAYLRSPEVQKIATDLGLRPAVPGIPLGTKISPAFGVDPNAKYDSYRPPKPEVVEAMLKSWQVYAKKPSLVVVLVDSSGSMQGAKLPAVQNTLQTYINSLGPNNQIALIDFDNMIRPPVVVDGTPEGRDRGLQFISNLKAEGGTMLYDATLYARNWLQQNLRNQAINAILILTDGEDSGSQIKLNQLKNELQKSGFNSDQRIALFTVGYGKEGEFNPDVLEKIAELNAGYYRKGNPETISKLMLDLQVEF
ncbi:MAG: VWA domain-containing protein [Okeania sp. SIO2C9]|uniref:extracellular solute-binding protein n=1 Tax=Okeania sp. SIO2C9 TaxID=2607791 RepID=UPI0013BF702A|nr:extracellular solute-binding protein [Okeania sp. SIO2C9]NEQ74897.1 VWA domain-containing protein [Okeania sp. SIO2C9]